MEVVGGVASVIAVVELAAKVGKICASYMNEVREAQSDIESLRTKTQYLEPVLKELVNLLNGQHKEKLKLVQNLPGAIENCQNQLTELVQRLESRNTTPPAAQPSLSRPTSGRKFIRKFFQDSKNPTTGASALAVVRQLQWPFEKKELQKILSRLGETQRIIQDALNVTNTRIILEINSKLNLNLPVAAGASFGWYGNDEHEPRCLPQTREDLLKEIGTWTTAPHNHAERHMLWLSGAAGTGKSTIARTVAADLRSQKVLGASFFFRRGDGDRAHGLKFCTTLASTLIQHTQNLGPIISAAIEKEPDLPKRCLEDQFETLILGPLSSVKPKDRIRIVVDALDECENENDIEDIVRLLARLKIEDVDLRVFITGRRETFIKHCFDKTDDVWELILHDIEEEQIKHDISVLIEHEFEIIKTSHPHKHTIPPDWPPTGTIKLLAEMSNPLFIIAATICRLLADRRFLPNKQLEEILQGESLLDANHEKSLSCEARNKKSLRITYTHILNQLVGDAPKSRLKILTREFQLVIGTIILLEAPLSQLAISDLTETDHSIIECRLDGFQSVLNIPVDSDVPIKTFHLSFREFLLDEETKDDPRFGSFWVDERLAHRRLAYSCVKLMEKHLKKNICDLKSPGIFRKEIPEDTIRQHISPALEYACKYWIDHLVKSGEQVVDDTEPHKFLQNFVLEWIETTCLLDIHLDNIAKLLQLESLSTGIQGTKISKFLYDIRRFLQSNLSAIDQAPLQTYVSALLFAPENSIVRKQFFVRHLKWVKLAPRVQMNWSAHLHTLKFQEIVPNPSVVFSQDGKHFSTITTSIEVWDRASGTMRQRHGTDIEKFRASTISHNGKFIVVRVDDSLDIYKKLYGQRFQRIYYNTLADEISLEFDKERLLIDEPVYAKLENSEEMYSFYTRNLPPADKENTTYDNE
ncbi:hypothetical protein H072_3710 [Dactylellina haptotyla CBS 200.50]|uniref:Nephrocystin 3-like N-terminal domain-containing protein n=1 Tax=Dactylellina haptotyla (strain CBS 200.50) TaxID=1284197 RepID=S8AHM0_DACHA|nr:hypothetical protein H072_3710 [Dactylellina haptotyla CBS 200.50]